jgi:hypothetical protein
MRYEWWETPRQSQHSTICASHVRRMLMIPFEANHNGRQSSMAVRLYVRSACGDMFLPECRTYRHTYNYAESESEFHLVT